MISKQFKLFFIFLALCGFLFLGCNDHNVTAIGNEQPDLPSELYPMNGITHVLQDVTLSWECSDPDYYDKLTYDVYIGTSTSPPLIGEDQPNGKYTIEDLEAETKYYWKIIAFDDHGGETEGEVWEFTTGTSGVNAFFADPNLEAEIREGLGIPTTPLTAADLLLLTNLHISYGDISDLEGIQYCENLTWLDISIYDFSNSNSLDISPLSGLTNLTDLSLYYYNIIDISPLSDLTNLTSLNLSSDQITDITPLSGLINLTSLRLSYNQISDISPLSGLINLTTLRLNNNQISDISPLSGLINLTNLGFSSDQIVDLSPLAGLTNLTNLDLSYSQIVDISMLSNLVNLTYLRLNYNQISDVSALSDMTNLTSLGLSSNQISDISPLSALTNLRDLYISHNQIIDINPLSDLTNMSKLYLSKNQIIDISSLSGLTNMSQLYLSYNQIIDISPLSGLTNISQIYLSENQIVDINPLVENEGIAEDEYVYLSNNPLSSESINTHIPELEARGVTVYH
jgi:Leucine-rich repeat (LRR) protein